jgi:hypothetical protein
MGDGRRRHKDRLKVERFVIRRLERRQHVMVHILQNMYTRGTVGQQDSGRDRWPLASTQDLVPGFSPSERTVILRTDSCQSRDRTVKERSILGNIPVDCYARQNEKFLSSLINRRTVFFPLITPCWRTVGLLVKLAVAVPTRPYHNKSQYY